MYIPKIVIQELDDMKQEYNLPDRQEALRKMVEHTRVGREVERIVKLDFRFKPTKFENVFGRKRRNDF